MDCFNEPEENYKRGYIKIYRSMRDHDLFQEKLPFSKFEAWCDLLLKANHKPEKLTIKNITFNVGRGETMRSLDTWASLWRWDKSKVRRFLNQLQERHMIVLKNETVSTRLTICNYDTYQSDRNANETHLKRNPTPNNKLSNIYTNVYIVEFDVFWKKYGKANGKKVSLELWNKLKPDDQKKAFDYLDTYLQKTPDKKFRKDCERYLKHRLWEDGDESEVQDEKLQIGYVEEIDQTEFIMNAKRVVIKTIPVYNSDRIPDDMVWTVDKEEFFKSYQKSA